MSERSVPSQGREIQFIPTPMATIIEDIDSHREILNEAKNLHLIINIDKGFENTLENVLITTTTQKTITSIIEKKDLIKVSTNATVNNSVNSILENTIVLKANLKNPDNYFNQTSIETNSETQLQTRYEKIKPESKVINEKTSNIIETYEVIKNLNSKQNLTELPSLTTIDFKNSELNLKPSMNTISNGLTITPFNISEKHKHNNNEDSLDLTKPSIEKTTISETDLRKGNDILNQRSLTTEKYISTEIENYRVSKALMNTEEKINNIANGILAVPTSQLDEDNQLAFDKLKGLKSLFNKIKSNNELIDGIKISNQKWKNNIQNAVNSDETILNDSSNHTNEAQTNDNQETTSLPSKPSTGSTKTTKSDDNEEQDVSNSVETKLLGLKSLFKEIKSNKRLIDDIISGFNKWRNSDDIKIQTDTAIDISENISESLLISESDDKVLTTSESKIISPNNFVEENILKSLSEKPKDNEEEDLYEMSLTFSTISKEISETSETDEQNLSEETIDQELYSTFSYSTLSDEFYSSEVSNGEHNSDSFTDDIFKTETKSTDIEDEQNED